MNNTPIWRYLFLANTWTNFESSHVFPKASRFRDETEGKYGGGTESVAIRSTTEKLEAVIQLNAELLEEHGLMGTLAEVEYVEGLKNPNDEVQRQIYQIMFERNRDINVGLFVIKASVYEFEQEVRVILFPNVSYSRFSKFPIQYKWICSSL